MVFLMLLLGISVYGSPCTGGSAAGGGGGVEVGVSEGGGSDCIATFCRFLDLTRFNTSLENKFKNILIIIKKNDILKNLPKQHLFIF